MNHPRMGTCEECGAAATAWVADLIRGIDKTGLAYCYRIHSKHAFCDEHDRSSKDYEEGDLVRALAGIM